MGDEVASDGARKPPAPPVEPAASPITGTVVIRRLGDRWSVVGPFVLVSALCVVAGGFVAALSRPMAFDLGPWLAAYLVLVGGVGQALLGLGQAWIAEEQPVRATVWAEILGWVLGSAVVVAGSVGSSPLLTTVGAVVMALTLGAFGRSARSRSHRSPPWPAATYWVLLVFLFVSVLTGVALAWARHG